MRAPLIWQIIGEKDSNTETKPYASCNNMSARRTRVISTKEIQFNHKPAKILLTEKRKESAKMAKPQV